MQVRVDAFGQQPSKSRNQKIDAFSTDEAAREKESTRPLLFKLPLDCKERRQSRKIGHVQNTAIVAELRAIAIDSPFPNSPYRGARRSNFPKSPGPVSPPKPTGKT